MVLEPTDSSSSIISSSWLAASWRRRPTEKPPLSCCVMSLNGVIIIFVGYVMMMMMMLLFDSAIRVSWSLKVKLPWVISLYADYEQFFFCFVHSFFFSLYLQILFFFSSLNPFFILLMGWSRVRMLYMRYSCELQLTFSIERIFRAMRCAHSHLPKRSFLLLLLLWLRLTHFPLMGEHGHKSYFDQWFSFRNAQNEMAFEWLVIRWRCSPLNGLILFSIFFCNDS